MPITKVFNVLLLGLLRQPHSPPDTLSKVRSPPTLGVQRIRTNDLYQSYLYGLSFTKILKLMRTSKAVPNIYTYTAIFNIYVKWLAAALEDSGDASSAEERRGIFIKALSVYFHMRNVKLSQTFQAGGLDIAAFNSLAKLVGVEEALQVSHQDIDALQNQHLSPIGQGERDWTRLSLVELRARYYDNSLPSEFVPQDSLVSQMSPVELLLWRDMAADNVTPDRVSYNVLIDRLSSSGQLSYADRYVNFVREHACSGATLSSFLSPSMNLKYEAALRQRQPQQVFSITGTGTREAKPEEQPHGSPLFFRTLWKLGGEYLRAGRFEDFAMFCHHARQSSPDSAMNCFARLIDTWRVRTHPEPTDEKALHIALAKYDLSSFKS